MAMAAAARPRGKKVWNGPHNDATTRIQLSVLRLSRMNMDVKEEDGLTQLADAPQELALSWSAAVMRVGEDREKAYVLCNLADWGGVTNYYLSARLQCGPLQRAIRAGRIDDVKAMMPIAGLFDCRGGGGGGGGGGEENLPAHCDPCGDYGGGIHATRMSAMHRIISRSDYDVEIFSFLLGQSPPPTAADLTRADVMGNTLLAYALKAVAEHPYRPGIEDTDRDDRLRVVRRLIDMGVPIEMRGLLRMHRRFNKWGARPLHPHERQLHLGIAIMLLIPTDGTVLFRARANKNESELAIQSLADAKLFSVASHMIKAGLPLRCELTTSSMWYPAGRVYGMRDEHLRFEVAAALSSLSRIILVCLLRPRRSVPLGADRSHWAGDAGELLQLPGEVTELIARRMAVEIIRASLYGRRLWGRMTRMGAVTYVNDSDPVGHHRGRVSRAGLECARVIDRPNRHLLELSMMRVFATAGAALGETFEAIFRDHIDA
jgi:hypothetical protein